MFLPISTVISRLQPPARLGQRDGELSGCLGSLSGGRILHARESRRSLHEKEA